MSEPTTRKEIVAVAEDTSVWNANPALTIAGVMGTVAMGVGFLTATGVYVPSPGVQAWANQYGLAAAALAIGGWQYLQGWLTRNRAFAPKTAATIAVVNTDEAYAAGKAGEAKPAPTLLAPP